MDFLWASAALGGLVGVQRKEFGDLCNSLADGRLERELGQMKGLRLAMLLVEGRPAWTSDGQLIHRWARLSLSQYRGVLWSAQLRGVLVGWSEDWAASGEAVRQFQAWSQKAEHSSLERRPGPKSVWGTPEDQDYAVHLLQGLPGMGPTMAKKLLAHFGRLPIGWLVGEEELLGVPGVGPGRVRKWTEALPKKDEKETVT